MTNKWIVTVLALIVGFLAGLLVAKYKSAEEAHHAMEADMHHDQVAMVYEHGGGHSHDTLYELPEGVAAPTIALTVHKDPKSGYNVEITTTNFTFAPEKASTATVAGEGHAHIYVDGKKINRVYDNWYHLADLGDEGEHTIRVELSANDHSVYSVNGEHIEAEATVVVE